MWEANLSLHFKEKSNKTILYKQKHSGPLLVQRPFYPEEKVAHVYIIHPPGGIVGGDSLFLNIKTEPNTQALVTTPAATKFYRTATSQIYAQQRQKLQISSKSKLEWLPQETILYDQAHSKLNTSIYLEPDALFIGWEIICFGLPASKQNFCRGQVKQTLEVWQKDVPLLIEKGWFEGGKPVFSAPWGLNNFTVMGTLICTINSNQEILSEIRFICQTYNGSNSLCSATLLNNLLLCRYLGDKVYKTKKFFINVWKILREKIFKCKVCYPRIWDT